MHFKYKSHLSCLHIPFLLSKGGNKKATGDRRRQTRPVPLHGSSDRVLHFSLKAKPWEDSLLSRSSWDLVFHQSRRLAERLCYKSHYSAVMLRAEEMSRLCLIDDTKPSGIWGKCC